MEKTLESLNGLLSKLQKLLSLHRQLLESLRTEREALLGMDVKKIHEAALEKQGILHQIAFAEQDRASSAIQVAEQLSAPKDQQNLSKLVLLAQSVSLKISDQLRSVQQALQLLVVRIQEQNQSNLRLVESSLQHLEQMKKNVIGESDPRSGTYSSSGQRQNAPVQSRLISTEV
ncbi:hypothetical protein EBZ37_14905 [bacterium]|nr:hypothetical protein [bacterium]